MDDGERSGPSMTIGAVSRATGVPTNTLRTWERRYGFPKPGRSTGGQRLYSPDVVPRLRLVARALALGHRPGQIMRLSEGELLALIDPQHDSAPDPGQATDAVVERWTAAIKSLDGPLFEALIDAEASILGLLPFLTKRVGPFTRSVGERWLSGELEVYQEHFATQRLEGFLTRQWRAMSDLATGPAVVCSTLPGERHILGLHMAACVLALHGYRVIFLGGDAPEADIAIAANQCRAVAVAISVSEHARPSGAEAQLEALLRHLDDGVTVVVGGGGAPQGVSGVLYRSDLNQLADWARARSSVAGGL